jgi:hypothetical protein
MLLQLKLWCKMRRSLRLFSSLSKNWSRGYWGSGNSSKLLHIIYVLHKGVKNCQSRYALTLFYRAPWTQPDFATLVAPSLPAAERGGKHSLGCYQISGNKMNKVLTPFCQWMNLICI